jgi:DNA phosphorothioation-associated putative methyltransferase
LAELGKAVADKLYLHVSSIDRLDVGSRELFGAARSVAADLDDASFNVLRLRQAAEEVSFLDYPGFYEDAFPSLSRSWRVDTFNGTVTYRDYRTSLNPPLLHRKELLLPPDDPRIPEFQALTASAESIGLFEDPSRIGFSKPWFDLIAKKGYQVRGNSLIPLGNDDRPDRAPYAGVEDLDGPVRRHLTALTRNALSAPVQSLVRHGLLGLGVSFFDYGCGKGDDLAGLASLEILGQGWDPHFRADAPRLPADVVDIGFVINVIEDFDERVGALLGAYQLSRRVLAVSAMLACVGTPGRAYRDGVITGRRTFQKYYTQADLQAFIESVLDEPATPVAPGVFYVFRDRTLEQSFFAKRNSSPFRVARARAPRPVRLPGVPRRRPSDVSPAKEALSERLWTQCVDLGRIPEESEMPYVGELIATFGSLGRALRYTYRYRDTSEYRRSSAARRDELRVFFALQMFRRQVRLNELPMALKADVRGIFGSMTAVEAEARALLFSIKDPEAISAACRTAADEGLGWLEEDHALHLHSSLVERLPAVLRVYVGCATLMYGDISQVDVLKLHLQSGKVTLMRFDDFLGKPLPAMVERVKVRLRDQEVDIFTYGEDFPPPLAYRKSRFINEESPNYAEQLIFDEQLEELNLVDLTGFGPSAQEFWQAIKRARWTVDGFKLTRVQEVPSIDASAGRRHSFRELFQCSDTWRDVQIPNVPVQHDTYNAYVDLCRFILDPLIDYFGGIRLTYGFCSAGLAKVIKAGRRGIEPSIDQHSAHERNGRGKLICDRGGAAVDFIVADEDMREVADWIANHLPFDRLYFYGNKRPLHVSYGPEHTRAYIDIEERNGRRIPRAAKRTP